MISRPTRSTDETTPSGAADSTRSALLVVSGVGLIVVMAMLGPKVGPIGVGTFIALTVAILATRSALAGHRDRRLR